MTPEHSAFILRRITEINAQAMRDITPWWFPLYRRYRLSRIGKAIRWAGRPLI